MIPPGGVCVHITLTMKRFPGQAPVALATQAHKLVELTRSLRAAPDFPSYYYNRAATLLSMKFYAEAAADADACLRLAPSHAKARFAKGRALYFLREYDSAFAQYDAGLKLAPHPKIAAWLAAERRKPEYAAQPGPMALAERLSDAVRAADTHIQTAPSFFCNLSVHSSRPLAPLLILYCMLRCVLLCRCGQGTSSVSRSCFADAQQTPSTLRHPHCERSW